MEYFRAQPKYVGEGKKGGRGVGAFRGSRAHDCTLEPGPSQVAVYSDLGESEFKDEALLRGPRHSGRLPLPSLPNSQTRVSFRKSGRRIR